METLVGTSTARTTLFPRNPFNPQFGSLTSVKRVLCRGTHNRLSSSSSVALAFSVRSRSSRNWSPLIVRAKKGNDNKKNKKADSHSFASKPDEAIGPFPEAVLLKEKKEQEDGSFVPEFADDEEQELFEFLNLQLESDLQVDRMRHYEVVYMIHQDFDDQVEKVNTKIQEFLKEKKGKLWRFSDWGMRRLAYKIKKATHAHYILINFELEAQWINDFKMMLDQDERVIRHLVVKRDKAITEDCPPPPEFHTLRGEGEEDYEEDEDDDDDEEYDDDDDEEWDDEDGDEDEEELELQDVYDDEQGENEGEDDDDDDDSAGIKQPAQIETPRKKEKRVEKAVR